MPSHSFFLALRYLGNSSREKAISSMVRICLVSIFVGSFSLALVSAIMKGFEESIHEKLQGIHAQLIIEADGQPLDVEKIATIINQKVPAVAHYAPRATNYGILRTQHTTHVVSINSIKPHLERDVTSLEKTIITDEKNICSLIHDNHIIMGQPLAKLLGISIGSTVSLFYSEDLEDDQNFSLQSKPIYIAGLFTSGIDDIDSNVIFCSQKLFSSLFIESEPTQILLKLHPESDEPKAIQTLQEILKLDVYSWKDLYKSLVATLKLERYVMFLILALVTFVACMNIISLLFMEITRKRCDIALLLTLGMPTKSIQYLFIYFALLISTTSTLMGLISAWICSILLTKYPCIHLPDTYLVATLPAKMSISIIASVFCCITFMSIIAAYISTRRIKMLNISQILRFEG